MNEPTEEQIKKFWEWYGWRRVPEGKKAFHYECCQKVMNWYAPDNQERSYKSLPPIDLNNLFEWAVPNTIKEIMEKWKITYNQARRKLVRWWLEEMERVNQKDELALFWAINKVIKGD